VHELEEVVLGLHVPARVAYERFRQRGILEAILLLAALPERAAIETDDRRVAEVGVDAVETGGIGDRDI
jgi:hypothetical protein